jgi:hypothetical protein
MILYTVVSIDLTYDTGASVQCGQVLLRRKQKNISWMVVCARNRLGRVESRVHDR